MGIKAYKGFNKDMTCRGFQYEEGKDYETDSAKVCDKGFHACEYPLYVFRYYEPSKSVFHEVELDGDIDKDSNDSKVASTKIHIGARLDIAGLVKASVEFIKNKCVKENDATGYGSANSATGNWSANSATGNWSANSATGDGSANSATGYGSANSATGYWSANSATGNWSANSATGNWSANSATGYGSANSATGNRSANSATGYGSANSATGDGSANSATGNWSANSATGYGSANVSTGSKCTNESNGEAGISVCWGPDSKAKGEIGNYLVISEWEDGRLICAKMRKVDGKHIKANTFYVLKDGKFVEVK